MLREYKDSDYNAVCVVGRDLNINYKFSLSPASVCFVYEEDDEVVGFVLADIFPDRAEIVDIVVLALYRNRGIGNILLNHIIDLCKEEELDNITLEVSVLNKTAIEFYEKNGFRTVSIRKKYYKNGTVDAKLMSRKL